jgi:hypothetical protein
LGSAVLWKARANCFAGNSTALLWQTLFGSSQAFLHNFQIVIAIAKFYYELGQGNQMFHLEAQWPSAPTAHFFQFRPLLIGHANVVSEVFLCHS